MTSMTASRVFDYKALRLIVGMIAFALPYLVIWISDQRLASISASYYTAARDVFVGLLFVVAAFLWAYNGHTRREKAASKVASIAAALVALFPTSCADCPTDTNAIIHSLAAIVLFSILAFFCLGPFRKNTKRQRGKKRRRAVIYLLCGWVIVLAMLFALAAKLALPDVRLAELRLVYWVELISLNAFGIAWITAGKYIPILVDKDEALYLFRQKV